MLLQLVPLARVQVSGGSVMRPTPASKHPRTIPLMAVSICLLLQAGLIAEAPDAESAVAETSASGPDIITSDVVDCEQLGRIGPIGSGTIGMACGTWVCNVGDQNLDWF